MSRLIKFKTSENEPDLLDSDTFRNICASPRYAHYRHIPDRMCACIERFGAAYDRNEVWKRFYAFYLFIGIVDDELDLSGIENGEAILKHLRRTETLKHATKRAPATLATEVLKQNIDPNLFENMLTDLERLYDFVKAEHATTDMTEYIQLRKKVGRLTADLSFQIVSNFIYYKQDQIRTFYQRVGEVGDLLDSLIDLKEDLRNQTISVKPGPFAYLQLAATTLTRGIFLLLRYPKIFTLFWAAGKDTFIDLKRREQESLM